MTSPPSACATILLFRIHRLVIACPVDDVEVFIALRHKAEDTYIIEGMAVMAFSQGAPDSDVVLSGQELLAAVADVLDSAPPDDEFEEPRMELKRTSENQDLRVGERASKRRRSAGTCNLAPGCSPSSARRCHELRLRLGCS